MAVQCSVCLSDDQRDGWSAVLPCGHVFHATCLEQCLERKASCPTCRQAIASRARQVHRVYFDVVGGEGDGENVPGNAPSLDQALAKLTRQEGTLKLLNGRLARLQEEIDRLGASRDQAQESARRAEEKARRYREGLERRHVEAAEAHARVGELEGQLSQADSAVARLGLATDTGLCGGRLRDELAALAERGLEAPEFFRRMLEVRNKQVSLVTNEAAVARQEAEQLGERVRALERRLLESGAREDGGRGGVVPGRRKEAARGHPGSPTGPPGPRPPSPRASSSNPGPPIPPTSARAAALPPVVAPAVARAAAPPAVAPTPTAPSARLSRRSGPSFARKGAALALSHPTTTLAVHRGEPRVKRQHTLSFG